MITASCCVFFVRKIMKKAFECAISKGAGGNCSVKMNNGDDLGRVCRASDRPHVLICGKRQPGKTTLIDRIIRESRLPVYGYRTKMERDGNGYGHVYIYPAGIFPAGSGGHHGAEDHRPDNNKAGNDIGKEDGNDVGNEAYNGAGCEAGDRICNEVGVARERVISVNTDVFNGLGCALLGAAGSDGMIVMDEIGYMEDKAEDFCRAVTAAFDGDIPVLATIKDTQRPSRHIYSILHHPKARVFMLDRENREEIYREVMKIVNVWEREITGKGEECEI